MDIIATLEDIADTLADEGDAAIKAGKRNSSADQDRIQQIYEAAEDICELCEALGADTGMDADEDEDAADESAEGGDAMMMAGKADRFGGKKRGDLEDSDFVDSERRSFPVMTAQDVKDAVSSWGRYKGSMTFDEFKRRLTTIAKRKGFADALPEAWASETKTMGVALKMADDDTIVGPAIFFGSEEMTDLSHMRDFFTKSTDFWLDEWDRRPMIWHHSMSQDDIIDEMRAGGAHEDEVKAMREALDYLDAHPVVGTWTKATVDPIAVWFKGQLSKAHQYRGAVKRLIEAGMIKISTDSAPHLVRRERKPNGAHEVKRWPVAAGSLTISAAEPRLFDVQAIKSLYDAAGIQLPFAIDDNPEAGDDETQRHDGAKADQERARRLALELTIMELTESIV